MNGSSSSPPSSPRRLKRNILLSTALIGATLIGYGRRAYAACTHSGGGVYACTGANATTQNINGGSATNAAVSTAPGFSVTTAAGNAITIQATGALSFTDTNASYISGSVRGLYISSTGDAGLTPGSITITSNAAISGGSYGIRARNEGSGSVTLDISGDVTGTSDIGIFAINFSSSGTDLSITTAAGTSIQGGTRGINAFNQGSGAVTLDISGDVIGGTNSIFINNSGPDDDDTLILRTGAGLSSASGADMGVGTDTLQLEGNGSEDEIFLNVETVEVNADATGWELTSTSSFDDLNINTGRFFNNGDLTINNAVTVASGATFAGTGTTTGNVVNDGIVAPGNSIGTMVIAGDFTQGAGGTLEIEFDNTGIDLLDISGTATLAGALDLIELAPGAAPGVTLDTPLVFLEADGGITGSFAPIIETFLMGTVITSSQVVIGATTASVIFMAGTGLEGQCNTQAGCSVAAALENADSADNAAVVDIANAINASASPADSLSSASGLAAQASVLGAAQGGEALTGAALGRVAALGGDAAGAYSGVSSGVSSGDVIEARKGDQSLWIQGVGGFGDIDSDARAQGSDYDLYGVVAGMDVRIEHEGQGVPDSTLGMFVGYSLSQSDVKGLNDGADVDAYLAGLYGRARLLPQTYLSGALSGAWLNFDTARDSGAGIASADFSGAGAFAQAELLYDLQADGYWVSPFIGVEGSYIHHEDYRESGAGVLNMNAQSEATAQLRTIIGVQHNSAHSLETKAGDYTFAPTFKLGWAHQYLEDSPEMTSSFSAAPSARFTSEGPARDRDSARLGAALDFYSAGSDSFKTYLTYDADIADNAQDHALKAGIKWTW